MNRVDVILRATLLVLVSAVLGCVPARPVCTPDYSSIPADIRSLFQARDDAAGMTAARERLQASAGQEFPDFDLYTWDGKVVKARSLVREPVTFFVLPPNSSATKLHLQRLEKAGWHTGDKRAVIALADADWGTVAPVLRHFHNVYRFRRPLPRYLQYVVFSPCELNVSSEFIFEGLPETHVESNP